MRSRNGFIAVLTFVLILTTAAESFAGGLYVGHGRRSADDAWSVRLNLSGGIHGTGDPWEDQFSDTEYPLGGYGSAGIEFNVGHRNSLELWGTFRGVNDEEDFLELDDFGDIDGRGRYDYDLESWSGGLTLRHRYPTAYGGSTYWGIGGGIVEAEIDYLEVVDGFSPVQVIETQTGATALALIGFEGRLAPGLALGLEIGYRHAWLEYENAYVEGSDSGVFAGLKLGVLLGGE